MGGWGEFKRLLIFYKIVCSNFYWGVSLSENERTGLSASIFSKQKKDLRGIYPELFVEGIPNAAFRLR